MLISPRQGGVQAKLSIHLDHHTAYYQWCNGLWYCIFFSIGRNTYCHVIHDITMQVFNRIINFYLHIGPPHNIIMCININGIIGDFQAAAGMADRASNGHWQELDWWSVVVCWRHDQRLHAVTVTRAHRVPTCRISILHLPRLFVCLLHS